MAHLACVGYQPTPRSRLLTFSSGGCHPVSRRCYRLPSTSGGMGVPTVSPSGRSNQGGIMVRSLPALLCCAVPLAAQSPFFPPPPAPTTNPVTTDKALLGMSLFWEEQLSQSDTVACGTCHQFHSGG